MQRVLFALAAVGFLAGSLSWLLGARRAYHRALAVEHRGLQAAQWRSLAAKDGLAGALLLSPVPVMVAEAVQGRTLAADWFLLLAVVPLLASLGWIRRFNRLAGLIEAEADYAQRQRERTSQEDELTRLIARRLGAPDTQTHAGIVLRTLFHPVEGQIGREDLLFVVGDVSGHGLQAAVQALRLKDLVLSAAVAGRGPADALALANAHLWADPLGEALATVFVGRYGQGVLRYANAGHLPETTPMVGLVRLAGLRWRVEQDYRELKGALGLDHFEGRGWVGWHHHVTLVSVAHGFLTLERRRSPNLVASA
jgi:Stage II sporulation protein E (SpoIIE)